MGRQPGRDAEFTEYVTARALWLRGVAHLLCGDWHRADDLVQVTVTKLYVSWHRARQAWNLDGYARKTLVNTFLAEQRTAWWRSVVLVGTDERGAAGELDLDAALDLRRALAALPLPDWYAGVGYGAGAHGDYAVARAASRGPGDLHPYAWLSVSRDANPPAQAPRGVGRHTAPAEPVNGRPAYWVTDNESDPTNGGDYFLRWQVSSELWAEMRAYYLPVNDARDTLLQIAADVTVADRPVPVPLRIIDLPADFVLDEVTLNRPPVGGTGAWEFLLSYRVNGESVGVSAYPAGTAEFKSDNSACTTADGVDVCVGMLPATGDRPAPPVPPALAAIGGMRGLLDRITVLGMDERNWTTRLYG